MRRFPHVQPTVYVMVPAQARAEREANMTLEVAFEAAALAYAIYLHARKVA